jgi:hypothetical protein
MSDVDRLARKAKTEAESQPDRDLAEAILQLHGEVKTLKDELQDLRSLCHRKK